MTIVTDSPRATEPPLAHRTALPRLELNGQLSTFGTALQVLGVLLISLLAYALVISPLVHMRAQHVAYNELRYAVANGIAPVGHITMADRPITAGTPLGTITIVDLGIHEVFSSGTSSLTLQSGPGHRRDTVLPGQMGASVIMGRQAGFGGPFANIGDLQSGQQVTTVTGQGESVYRVTGIRYGGDPLPDVLTSTGGRLTLVSAAGTPFLPSDIVRVDMELISEPFETPRSVISAIELDDSEATFASDPSGWPWIVIWLAVWFAVVGTIKFLGTWWGRAQSWIVGAPVFALVTSLLGGAIMLVVPNVL